MKRIILAGLALVTLVILGGVLNVAQDAFEHIDQIQAGIYQREQQGHGLTTIHH